VGIALADDVSPRVPDDVGSTLRLNVPVVLAAGAWFVIGALVHAVEAVYRLLPLVGGLYRRNRPSASGLDPEGEGRKLFDATQRTASTVARWIKDLNPKQLPAVAWNATPLKTRSGGETGVVGRGGAADPHGRTGRSGVNSSRSISGRSRGIKFACDPTARFGTCGQDGEAAGLVPAVLHAVAVGLPAARSAWTPRDDRPASREPIDSVDDSRPAAGDD
jgi:hypothetical protein